MDSFIILQFATDSDLSAIAIKWFTRGPYSHVDYVLDDGTLLGARFFGGVKIRKPGYAKFSATKRIRIPTTQDGKEVFHKLLYNEVGKPYDLLGILGFVANRDWRQQDAWFCSELMAYALELCNVFPYKLASPDNKISPNDLYLAISVICNVASVL